MSVAVITILVFLIIATPMALNDFYHWVKERKAEKRGKAPYRVASFREGFNGEAKNDKV